MYEHLAALGGLGWSDYLVDGEHQECGQVVGGVKKCFTRTSADEACAQNSGCFELSESCSTTSGGSGNAWCCPRHLPPPPGSPCLPQSTEMACQRHAVRCATFGNDSDYATCRIQKALCDQGVDPGPIDGQGDSDMYRIAIRMYKARQGIIPDNDDPSSAIFLERLGLSSDTRVSRGAQSRGLSLPPAVTNWFWPVAFGLSTVFFGATLFRYGRS